MSDCLPCSTGVDVPATPTYPAFPPPVGSTTGSSSDNPATPTCPDYAMVPTVLESFITPEQGQTAQFLNKCAYLWAQAGMDLMILPLGRISITGVQGNVITYVNRTIPANRTIQAGTWLVVAGTWDVRASESPPVVDYLLGFKDGFPILIGGGLNYTMKRVLGEGDILKWQAIEPPEVTAGLMFYPLPSPVTVLEGVGPQSDVLPSFPGAGCYGVFTIEWASGPGNKVTVTVGGVTIYRDDYDSGGSIMFSPAPPTKLSVNNPVVEATVVGGSGSSIVVKLIGYYHTGIAP